MFNCQCNFEVFGVFSFLVGLSPGEKRRQEARPALRYVLQLREAASGHPESRGRDARSGLCLSV